MTRFTSTLAGVLLLIAVALPALGADSAAALSNGGGNSGDAPGQEDAFDNCMDTRERQVDNGQTGSNTGSDNDNKQGGAAVTNCFHNWQP